MYMIIIIIITITIITTIIIIIIITIIIMIIIIIIKRTLLVALFGGLAVQFRQGYQSDQTCDFWLSHLETRCQLDTSKKLVPR